MKYQFLLILFLIAISHPIFSQESNVSPFAYKTFASTRVVVGHSVELLQEGEMDFLISHKFGRVNGGLYEFFGLDQAIIRIGLDYAFKAWINIGIGRSSLDKQLDAFVKLRLLRQQQGEHQIPFSLTGLATTSMTLLRATDPTQPLAWQNRLTFTYQLLAARKFGDRFSLQIMPTLTHFNLVDLRSLPNDVLSIGLSAKVQLRKNISFKSEYYYTLPNQLAANKTNSLAIGFDIDTGSHVFQLHFSNSGGLIEPAFIGNTTGNWLQGDIHFGFTISRVFKLKGRRY